MSRRKFEMEHVYLPAFQNCGICKTRSVFDPDRKKRCAQCNKRTCDMCMIKSVEFIKYCTIKKKVSGNVIVICKCCIGKMNELYCPRCEKVKKSVGSAKCSKCKVVVCTDCCTSSGSTARRTYCLGCK